MNTSDQNVLPMDTAFKRRFDWRYISTDPVQSESLPGTYLNNPKILLPRKTSSVSTTWVELYQAVNKYILGGYSPLGVNEDKQVGQFFIQFERELIDRTHDDDSDALAKVLEIVRNKLLMFLWEDIEGRNGMSGAGEKRLFLPDITSYGELNRRSADEQSSRTSSSKIASASRAWLDHAYLDSPRWGRVTVQHSSRI